MRSYENTVFRLKIPHTPGQLAGVVNAIADARGLVGEIETVRLGEDFSIREITVQAADCERLEIIEKAIRDLDGVHVLVAEDRTFARHEHGKIETSSRIKLDSVVALRDIYTPGVAKVCMALAEKPELAFRYTGIGNTVAIVTNGTRVLGLGNIGALASMPVMEGKSVMYREFVDVSAVPILVSDSDPKTLVDTVIQIAPGFAGIHLEDIRVPDCYEVEERLDKALPIPVMHDDRHGTGVVTLSAIINAVRFIDRKLTEVTVGQIGLGAAGSGISHLAAQAGARVIGFDPNPEAVAYLERHGGQGAAYEEIMKSCDIVVATSGKPGLIKPEHVRKGQIIFALSNPVPEIEPEDAIAAGAARAYDGACVNNYLGFPGLFRGALEARSKVINWEMKLAAAAAIARCAADGELIPDPLNREVHHNVAKAVARAAQDTGVSNTATPAK